MPVRPAADISRDPRILFVTSRAVDAAYDNPIGTAIKEKDISKVLEDDLPEEAIESLKNNTRMISDNLRVGEAWNDDLKKTDSKSTEWKCDIFEDAPPNETTTQEAQAAYKKLVDTAKDHNRPILLYAHGYNNKVTTPLQATSVLREKYDCEVICFMWPTDGVTLKYDKDREDARITARPFLRFLRKSEYYLQHANNTQPVTLLCHSMGNYVLKNAINTDVENSPYQKEGKDTLSTLFTNIILTGADVDSEGHVEWVSELKPKQKLFICINRGDKVLWLSDAVAGRVFNATNWLQKMFLLGDDHKPRLGQTLSDIKPTSDRIYVDIDVGKENPWDLFQGLEGEHWYHLGGQGDIETFYKDAIHSNWKKEDYKSFLDEDDGNYYKIRGHSEGFMFA